MSRRFGHSLSRFAALAGAVLLSSLLVAEAIAGAFFFAGAGDGGPLRALFALHLGVAVAAALSLATLVRATDTDVPSRDPIDDETIDAWISWWREGLLGRTDDPPGPLPAIAIEAFLRLRDTSDGAEAAALDQLGIRFGVADLLIERLREATGPDVARALEDVGRGRIPAALGLVYHYLPDRGSDHWTWRAGGVHPVVRRAALRAAARILGALPPARAREESVRFEAALMCMRLSPEVSTEALLLLGGAARSIVPSLLRERALPIPNLRGALHAAGRLRLAAALQRVLALASHGDAEVRAAALRALRAIGSLPPAGEVSLRATMRDEHAFVRVHAARAASLLPQAAAIEVLWGRLGDSSWWVRLAAAETIRGLGAAGEASLLAAAERHPDPFARDMARQFAPAVEARPAR